MTDDRRMSTDRFYGGTTSRIRTLHQFLKFLDSANPSRETAYDWLADNTDGGSRSFAERNVDFLITSRILDEDDGSLRPGRAGEQYLRSHDPIDLYNGFTAGVKGFETILEALTAGPMTDQEIANRLREVFPDYKIPVNVAKRHREWLQVLGLLSRIDDRNCITNRGRQVIGVTASDDVPTSDTSGQTYETQSSVVTVSEQFRTSIFEQYDGRCLLTKIDHPSLVTLAHVLPRSEYVEYAEDPRNVFVLNWTHHMAFDAGLFTFDSEYRLRVKPDFKPTDHCLRRTLLERDGDQIRFPADATLAVEYLDERNQQLDWWPVQ